MIKGVKVKQLLVFIGLIVFILAAIGVVKFTLMVAGNEVCTWLFIGMAALLFTVAVLRVLWLWACELVRKYGSGDVKEPGV